MYYVVLMNGKYKVWEGSSAGVLLLLGDHPGTLLDPTPFVTEEEAEQRRRQLTASAVEPDQRRRA